MSDISIRGVRKSYGKTEVVHGVDLEIVNGEFVVILGPSGCGKSTLLRMIAGLEEITSGEIAIAGRVVNKLEPRERGCAMVFQNYALYPHMTVAQNIGYSLKVAGVARAERDTRIAAIAAIVGLTDFLDRRPAQLSGGQRQRVAMARAMIKEPKVFLFDEPLSNLDAKLRVQMRVEIRKLHQRLGATSIFVTHDQVEAMTLADRLVVMNAGNVEQVGTPAEIYRRPASRYVGGFIGAPGMNFLSATLEGDVLRLGDGQTLSLDRRRYAAQQAGPVTLGIRAEQIEVGATGLNATFDFAEELGAGRLIHSEIAGESLIAQISDDRSFTPGTALRLAVPSAKVQLFDTTTGKRIEETVSAERPALQVVSA